MLAFYLVPLYLVKSNQSNAVTFPLAMGWGQESQESLSAFVPHLERAGDFGDRERWDRYHHAGRS